MMLVPRSGAVRSEIGVKLAGQAPGQLQSLAAPGFPVLDDRGVEAPDLSRPVVT